MTADVQPRPARRVGETSFFILIAVVATVLLALVLNYHTYSISSASGLPNMRAGDVVVGSKWPYGLSRYSFPVDLGFGGRIGGAAPRRGDLAVFVPKRDASAVWVKRVVGLPGDTVQMKEGRLVINGATAPREAIPKVRADDGDGHEAEVPTYRETLPGGVSYAIIEVQGDSGFYDNTDVVRVPQDAYFVLGDNRDNSLDSRMPVEEAGLGFVPLDNFVARVEFTLLHGGTAAMGSR